MEWLTHIGISAAGLPWPGVLLLLLLIGAARELIPAALKWRAAIHEERKYDDSEAKTAREQLVQELRSQVNGLCEEVSELSRKLDTATAAHAKCELEQEKIRGDMRVMQVQIERLMSHEKNGTDLLDAPNLEIRPNQ